MCEPEIAEVNRVISFQLKELKEELERARSKRFKVKIAEVNRQIETYTREKEKADGEIKQFKARLEELQAKLDAVDTSLKALDPSANLSSFADLCESSCFFYIIITHFCGI